MAGHSTNEPDRRSRQRQPRKQRQPKLKTQLEFWAFLIANTGNTLRVIALCLGASLAIAAPFAILALVFTLLHVQFAVPAAMYAGATAVLGALGVAVRSALKSRPDGGSGNGGDDSPGDASDESE